MGSARIGLIGLGNMGVGMAGRLLDAGYSLTVHNRSAEKARTLVERGAAFAKTPAEAAAGAAILLSIVSDDDASRRVWLGPEGALRAAAAGTTLIECSTLSAEWIDELARLARERELILIDAPVTGSKPQAASGQLLFLAGGPETAISRITPTLLAMGRGVVHVGPTGSGARMKLINNFMAASQTAALAEAIGLIEHSGIDLTKALGVLLEGAPGSPMVKTLSSRMLEQAYDPPNFSAKLMAKDLRYALDLARTATVSGELTTASATLKVVEGAIASGRGESDISVMVEQFRKR